eukprot:TRINITY_DN12589_c0_g1_i1.p1 TRINITY_DN12589_c0_g1~~TRINITY_DN12589_c0_g1_i1.p1  ORF type:complete len:352 (+),score=17.39 TRINITY_DN12589_c0_g1_i1:95-1057(+)
MSTEYIPYIFAGYTVASFILLKKPGLLHTKKQTKFIRLIAHRGGAAEGYENTLSTYRRAVGIGTEMLELDVQLSKDGQVVVAHDNNLSRLTGHNTLISQTDYSDLPSIQKTVPVDFNPGQYYCQESGDDSTDARKFTLLDSVLKEFPDTQINIDIKMESLDLVKAVNKVICDHKAEDRCVWGSFSGNTTNMCYRENPNVGIFFSAPRMLKLLLLYYTGLLPFVPLRETHFEVPMLSIFLDPKYAKGESTISFGRIPRPILVICDFLLFRPSLMSHLAARGIPTYVWVLNTETEFRRALAAGAAGIMTDHPSRLKLFFLEK